MSNDITEIYAWFRINEDGKEGLVAASHNVNGKPMMMPLITTQKHLVPHLNGTANEIHQLVGGQLVLLRFSNAEIIQTIGVDAGH